MRDRKIYYREKENSYLPVLNGHMIRVFFRDELEAFVSEVKAGKIISSKEHWERFRYEEKREDGSGVWHTKPEGKRIRITYDFFRETDNKLRIEFGNWVPLGFTCYALWSNADGEEGMLKIAKKAIPGMAQQLTSRLMEEHSRVDGYLKQLHETFPAGDEHDERSIRELIARVGKKIVDDEVERTQCDDAWWGWLEDYTVHYLESINCMMDDKQSDDLMRIHFRSWSEPSEDEVQKYLDELSAVSIKIIFEQKYRKNE
jgi:hypothetical protein